MRKTLITLLALSSISYGFTYSDANTWLQTALVEDITSYTITFQIDDEWSKQGGENIFTFSSAAGDQWHIRHEVARYMGLSTDGSSVNKSYESREGSAATYTINLDEVGAYNRWFFDGDKGNNGNGLKGVTVEISCDSTTGTSITLTAPDKTVILESAEKYYAPATDGTFGFISTDSNLKNGNFMKSLEIEYTANGVTYSAAYPDAVIPSVPEPATATLSLLALAGLAARRRRK